MAALEHVVTRVRFPLAARTLVGRSHACQLRLSPSKVSGVHAELTWDGERWLVHDLGSRNGTLLDGQRLAPEQHEPLVEGSRIAFGTDDEQYVLVDVSPPSLVAIAEDGTGVGAVGGLLCLPSDESPEVSLCEQRDGGWQLETEQGPRAVTDAERIVVGAMSWRLYLPGSIQHTDIGDVPLSVDTLTLHFIVSHDQQHVQVRVEHQEQMIDLPPRAHDHFLLALARARSADEARAQLEPSDQGWVYRRELVQQLGADRHRINLWVHRARRQFADVGVLDVARLVERRRGAEQLRLGISRIRIPEATVVPAPERSAAPEAGAEEGTSAAMTPDSPATDGPSEEPQTPS